MKINKRQSDIYMTPDDHKYTLIWMHGLGDTAEGWVDLFREQNPCPPNMKIVLLTAPTQKVTVNMGMEMPSWYDIVSLNFADTQIRPYDLDTVELSSKRIYQVLQEEIDILNENSQRVFIGGFSQGGCMALHCGLNFDQKLGGILSFSALLFPHITNINQNNQETPIQIFHGEQDVMIPWQIANMSYLSLKSHPKVNIKTSQNLGHSINNQGIDAIKTFLDNVVNKKI